MEPLILVYYYYYEGYNVFVTIEFFPHIDVMMAENRDIQGPSGLNTFLNLFNH